MSYYDALWGNNVKFGVTVGKEFDLKKAYGKERSGGPFRLKYPPQGFPDGYPMYEVTL